MKNKIFEMYDKEKYNENCRFCKKFEKDKLAGIISIFHVGSNFEKDKYRIVFVGKNTFYSKKDFEAEANGKHFADVTQTGRDSIRGEGIKSSYWSYIRAIIAKLYDKERFEDAIENISLTNIIKCNTTGEDGDYRDKTPKEIIDSCLKSRIFEKEIKILKPKHIVFFTGKYYDDYLNRINLGDKIRDKGDKTIDNGKIVLWERDFLFQKEKIKVLRISHPQGKHKEAFVDAVVSWIKNS